MKSIQNHLEKNQGNMIIKTESSNSEHVVNKRKKQKRLQKKGAMHGSLH